MARKFELITSTIRATPAWIFTLCFESVLMIVAATLIDTELGYGIALVLLGALVVYMLVAPIDGWTLWWILSAVNGAAVLLRAEENGVVAFFAVIAATGAAYLLLDQGRETSSPPRFQ